MARRRRSDPNYDELADASASAFRRLGPRGQLAVVVVLLVAAGVAAVLSCHQERQRAANVPPPPLSMPGGPPASVDMFLGNPSAATSDPGNRNNYLMVKPFFSLSYNDASGTPNWVSWRVTRSDLGEAPRKQLFDPDMTLPAGFKVVAHKDYSGSGFDRGHMCPHSDRAANEAMSFATFVMTNIIPQAPNVNEKAWAQMENYCRDLVRRSGDRLYVVAGPAGRGGRGTAGFKEVIGGGGKVVVPAECWKVVVAIPDPGEDDLAKITAGSRVIAVVMPNDQGAVGEAWAQFRTSAGEIERRTGLHFFDRLPAEVAEALRRKVDEAPIAPPRPIGRGRG